jgi:hypothetical protein
VAVRRLWQHSGASRASPSVSSVSSSGGSSARPSPCPRSRSPSFSCFCGGGGDGHGTPGVGISPRSQRARRSARRSIHGPALESAQPLPPPLPLLLLLPTATIVTAIISAIANVTLVGVGVGASGVASACAGATECGGKVFGGDEVEEERRVLVGVIRTEDGDLVERAWGEPRLDHAPDGGEGRRCVDDDQLAHTADMSVSASAAEGRKLGRASGGTSMGAVDVRLGKVVLGDVEEAPRDGLEGPELGEPEALEVNDDERLAYRPTGGGGRGWEHLGEESLDVDEDGLPMLLGSNVLVEPLETYRAEALDVYRTAELHTTEVSGIGRKPDKDYLVGLEEFKVKRGGTLNACRDSSEEDMLGAYLVKAHWPALKDFLPRGELHGNQRKDGGQT